LVSPPGIVWFRAGAVVNDSADSILDVAGFFFAIINFILNVNFVTQIYVIPPDMPLFMKERSAGKYGPASWYLARTLTELRLELPYVVFQVAFVYLFIALRPNIRAFLSTLFVFLLLASACQGMGQFVGVFVEDWKWGHFAGFTFFQFNMITNGYIVSLTPAFDWLKYISVYRAALVPMLFFQNTDELVEVCTNGGQNCEVVSWRAVLGPDSNTEPSTLYCVIFLAAMAVLSRVAALLALMYRKLENEA
jgi:hypothetical protein